MLLFRAHFVQITKNHKVQKVSLVCTSQSSVQHSPSSHSLEETDTGFDKLKVVVVDPGLLLFSGQNFISKFCKTRESRVMNALRLLGTNNWPVYL